MHLLIGVCVLRLNIFNGFDELMRPRERERVHLSSDITGSNLRKLVHSVRADFEQICCQDKGGGVIEKSDSISLPVLGSASIQSCDYIQQKKAPATAQWHAVLMHDPELRVLL